MTEQWFNHFWTAPGSTPEALAFGLFSWTHLTTLIVLGIITAAIVVTYCRIKPERRRAMRLALGIAMLISEGFRQFSFLILGIYRPEILPLHLCAIATFCVIIDSVKPSGWTREFLYAAGTWGPICALIFADWANQPIFNIFTWQSFLTHALILSYPLMLVISGDYRPNGRQLWKAGVIVLGAVVVSWIVNTIYNTNFWFLNVGSPGSPLEPIQTLTGALYLPVLVVILGIIWTLLYLPWRRKPSANSVL
ncbi:MAG: YwaF family protein [Propionibacteriaceae bacterium]|jgi:hypothetical integral membrane protein (TIGR02206 family)|nr:YwaF family protein [Propionibacteriaceae bacterium]